MKTSTEAEAETGGQVRRSAFDKTKPIRNDDTEIKEKIDSLDKATSSKGQKQIKNLKQRFCELCSEVGDKVLATLFCKEDNIKLCDGCGKRHKVQQATKDHTIISAQEMPTFNPLCELCASENVSVPAYGICSDCADSEQLCLSCSKRHTAMKQFRQHKISPHQLQSRIDVDSSSRSEESKSNYNPTTVQSQSERKIPGFMNSKEMSVSARIRPYKTTEVLESDELKGKRQKTICGPCSGTNAEQFCVTCIERLCNTCFEFHAKQSLTRDHRVLAIMELQKHPLFCSICKEKADFFCKGCSDNFCSNCKDKHLSLRASREHNMTDILTRAVDIYDKANIFCEPCKSEGKEVLASSYCLTCDESEPMCDDCSRQHTKQKLTRNHKICTNIKKFFNSEEGKKTSECIRCSHGAKQSKSHSFSLACNVPEPICEECASKHLKPKMTRSQVLSDFDQTIQPKKELFTDVQSCGPCEYEGKQVTATAICQTCSDPEPLCHQCANDHKKQKSTRQHLITQIEKSIKKEVLMCEPCKYENIESEASSFCLTCIDPEPLCRICEKNHLKQPKTRGHEICDNLKLFKKFNKSVKCVPCSYAKQENEAICFCSNCDDPEPLCKACALDHLKQKQYRTHVLCYELTRINQETKIVFCDVCQLNKECNIATSFCLTCKEKTAMCTKCTSYHKKERSTREHELCYELERLHSIKKQEKSSNDNKCKSNGKDSVRGKEKSSDIIEPKMTPGKPSVKEIRTDSVTIVWEKPDCEVDYYQIRFKSDGDGKWKIHQTDKPKNETKVEGLMAKTKYIFQVRGIKGDDEGKYSPSSDIIETKKSLAKHFVDQSVKMDDGSKSPSRYRLPTREIYAARNSTVKTRKLCLGNEKKGGIEKTVMLVGATGSGKSTLVDGIINYILGVSFEDPFRFTLVQLEEDEKKTHNQAISQTEWITVYRVCPQEGSRLQYTINIIDTPGFGDTRGIERDCKIVDQIHHLFSAPGEEGVLFIDSVCFIVKAPDARLTVNQKYIFNKIMALFGKDIASNICTLVTFADGADPPVLASLKEANLPFGEYYPFNNSALFSENKNIPSSSLSPMFWDMGCKSFQNFFEQLRLFETKSLSQTKDVLKEREHLQSVIVNVHPQVQAGLSKISELSAQLDILKKHKSDIENNKDFKYKVDETRQIKTDLEPGKHVTNCLQCHITCHKDCKIPDDDQKRRCCAMDSDGYCQVCPDNCIWSEHKNTPYIFEYVTNQVEKTYTEMKEKFEKAKGETMSHERYVASLSEELDELFNDVQMMMQDMNKSKNRLKEIALRPDPLSTVEHIDLMIQAEEMEKQVGFEKRIKVLMEFKQFAQIDSTVANMGQQLQTTRQEVYKTTGKDSRIKNSVGNIDQQLQDVRQPRPRSGSTSKWYKKFAFWQ